MQVPLPFTPIRGPRERDIELGKHVTRRQRHLLQIRHIPRAENDPPIPRIIPQLPDYLRQLIDSLPRIIRFCIHVLGPKMPPLESIDWT